MRISDWSSDVCSSDLGIAAGGVGQDGVAVRRQHVEQVGLSGVLADVAAADGDGDDLRACRLGGGPGFVEVLELAGAGEQAGAIGLAGNDQCVAVVRLGIHRRIIAQRTEENTSELQSLMRTSYAVFSRKRK